MIKKFSLLVALVMIITVFTSCNKGTQETGNNNDGRVKVAVSFNALKQIAMAIGKDKIYIYTIVPNGVEPHDFEPKIKDFQQLSDAKVFIYNGVGMESWVDKAVNAVDNKNLIKVNASTGCDLIKNSDNAQIKEHGQYDPHIWLSLKNAKIEACNIKNALEKADPINKDYFEANYNEFIANTDKLFEEYKPKFDSLSNKSFVTGHAAFAYFCRDFNLKQNSVEDVFAEGEPSSKKIEELVNYCRQNKVRVIFTEDMASPKVSKTLAQEVNAKAEKIYTIESQEDNKSYLSSMKENIQRVYDSLK
ncbi:MAG: zinc ABC transporter substrate-binding protein [Bacillota bacterium]|nr:zinc ABC transporter substrate-binding protein [Bacillota bacterium]